MSMTASLLPSVLLLYATTEAPVRVTVRPEQAGGLPEHMYVVARPVSFSGPEQVQVLDPASGGLAVTFSLEVGGLYELTVRADGWWSRSLVLRAGAEREAVLRIWPLLPRVFRVSRAAVGSKAEAWFSSDGQLSPRNPPSEHVACSWQGEDLVCPLPSFVQDVRLAVTGFAPAYVFDLQNEMARPLALKTGGSLSGWVNPDDGGERIDLRLARAEPRDGRVSWQRDLPVVTANRKGFFQFAGLLPGVYLLRGKAGNRSFAPREVEVREGSETVLAEVLALVAPLDATVTVNPPLGPDQKPWTVGVRLGKADPYRRILVPGHPTAPQGVYRFPKLEPGAWTFVVTAPGDLEPWHEEVVEVNQQTLHVLLHLPVLTVNGTVTKGGQGVRGKLELADRRGRRVALATDSYGRFSGFLPEAGEYALTFAPEDGRTPVRLGKRRVAPPAEGGAATLELTLDFQTLRGVVLGPEGFPEEGAVVTAVDHLRGIKEQVKTGSDGRFSVSVKEGGGWVSLAAQKGGMASGWLRLELDSAGDGDVELHLEKTHPVRGTLTDAQGKPVKGAEVLLAAEVALNGSSWWQGSFTATDARGQFSANLPLGSQRATVVARHPGFPLALAAWWPGLEQVDLRLSSQGGSVRVRAEEGRRYEFSWQGLWVPWDALRPWSTKGEGDLWLLPPLPSGEVGWCTVGAGESEKATCVQGYVVPGGTLDLAPAQEGPGAPAYPKR